MEQRFEKDGRVKVAHSPAEAVKLRFDGYKEAPEEATGGTKAPSQEHEGTVDEIGTKLPIDL